ncbi:hypothetical protein CRE_22915 [Caenorhabditis remanei]|uniref:F-box domain-containing protein n=1 Tax=Caenorhabditis remanei TaxID=31234 RepID=E3MW31_CAERE|nr:hypothetical protein CRE_22915 [Caenorhabditis remanei]
MTEQPFKLLHLPAVALRNVLQFLNPFDLFELSQCSQKATYIIPLSGSRKFKLVVNASPLSISVNDHVFHIGYNRSPPPSWFLKRTWKFMDSTVRVVYLSRQQLISYWDDRFVGLKTVFFHLSKIFNCAIESAKFYSIPAVIYMSIIDFISSRQSEIKELFVGGENLTDTNVTEIFERLRVTDHLSMCHRFSMPPPSISLNSKSMFIWNSGWITTEHLNSMKNGIVIHLDHSTLTDDKMTLFLNDWKSGQFPNLQYLYIQSTFLSKTFTPLGLPPLQDTVNPQFHMKTILGVEKFIY